MLILIVLSILSVQINIVVMFTAFSIATLNVVAGAWYIDRALVKPGKTFVTTVFGSMVIRIILILILIFAGIFLAGFNAVEFVFTVMGFYMFYLIIELKFIVDKVNGIKKAKPQN